MSFHRRDLPGSPVSQGSFSQRSQRQSALALEQQQVKWRKPRVWGLLMLALLVGLFMSVGKTQASPASQTQTTTRTFPVGAQPDLSIADTDAGFIHVHTGSNNTVVITTTIKSKSGPLPTVNYATPDSNHIIVTVTDNSPTSDQNQVNFDVTVPTSIDLELDASAGDITVDGIQGTGHLQSGAGNITLSNTTLSGSGSVTASAGTIIFAGSIAQGAAYQFQNSAGNIGVILPSNTNCHVDASTSSGSIQSDFSEVHIHTVDLTGAEGEGDIGSSNPSATLSLQTETGSIAIREAAR